MFYMTDFSEEDWLSVVIEFVGHRAHFTLRSVSRELNCEIPPIRELTANEWYTNLATKWGNHRQTRLPLSALSHWGIPVQILYKIGLGRDLLDQVVHVMKQSDFETVLLSQTWLLLMVRVGCFFRDDRIYDFAMQRLFVEGSEHLVLDDEIKPLYGKDYHRMCHDNYKLIEAAIRCNDVRWLRRLIHLHSMEFFDSYVAVAVACGSEECFRVLLEDYEYEDLAQFEGLLSNCVEGNFVSLLAHLVDLELFNKRECQSALLEALKRNNVDCATILAAGNFTTLAPLRTSEGRCIFEDMIEQHPAEPTKEILDFCLSRNCDVNSKNGDGFSPLDVAVRRGLRDTCVYLIRYGATMTTGLEAYSSFFSRDSDLFQVLISQRQRKCNQKSILRAIQENFDVSALRFFANYDCIPFSGPLYIATALHAAVSNPFSENRFKVVEYIGSCNPNSLTASVPDACLTPWGLVSFWTPGRLKIPHLNWEKWCCRLTNEDEESMISSIQSVRNRFMELGVDEAKKFCHSTFLDERVFDNFFGPNLTLESLKPAHVRYLIENGADPHSALLMFTKRRLMDQCAVLFEFGVPAQAALLSAVQTTSNGQFIEFLVSKGADVDAEFALHAAVVFGSFDNVECLLNLGANIDLRSDKGGRTPLIMSAHNMDDSVGVALAEVLIKRGASLDVRDHEGRTPLFYSCITGNFKLVELLVENGADYSVPDSHGVLPLQIANLCARYVIPKERIWKVRLGNVLKFLPQRGHVEIARLLQSLHTKPNDVSRRSDSLLAKRYGILSLVECITSDICKHELS